MGPGAPATTRRRAKSFLRNYYGIQQTDATAQDGVKSKTTEQTGHVAKSDPYDLDSHSFEVEKYMHKMFVEKQLPGIVQADNELVAEIRQLDGDMKTLVYENYSKFLSATDTINNMKSNVDNLESEMTRLTENIGKIATSSGAIHNSLGTKREKIRQLNGVHSLLTKLQFVFELPTNLHQCLEAGSYTQAVKSYCRTLSLLQHYKHLTVFTGIERECKAIMVQIAYKLRQKMCSEQATITEISECVGMLLALKEDPVALWKQYLDLATKCLDKINSTVLKNIEKLPLYIVPSEKSPKPAQTSDSASIKKTPIRKNSRPLSSVMNTPATPTDKELASTGSNTPAQQQAAQSQDKVSYMNTHFLRYVEGFVISFRSYFLSSAANINSHNVPADTDGMLSDQRPAGWIVKETRAHAGLTREQQTQAESAVKGVVSKITGGFLDTVASFLEYPDDIANMRPDVHVHVLQSLHLGTLANPGLCQMVRFDTLVTGLNQNWENRLIERALTVIKEGLLDRIREQDMSLGQKIHSAENTLSASMYEPSGPGSPHIMKDTIIWLKDVFKLETVTFLEKCLSSDAQFLDTKEGRKLFLKNIQTGFRMFWDQFLTEVKQLSQSKVTTSHLSLITSRLCFDLAGGTVEQLYKTLSKTLFRPGKRTRSGSFVIESYDEPPVIPQLQWDCKSVTQSCQESGHLLLDEFIARTGNDLSWIVMDWQSKIDYMVMSSPPAKVSASWENVYQCLNEVERQLVLVYGDEGERMGHREISSESTRRETTFRTGGGGGGSHSGNGGSRMSHRNESLASYGSNTMNSRFENQQRNLLSNIDKLFSERVEIFVRCQDLHRTGILFGIIKILLKAWAESVRLKTFGRGGFQQVQVDAEFAKVWLWRFATADERLLYSLLEECQQTAYRRCMDPAPLDINMIESIINSKER